jgi:hypothetical protein
MYSMKYVVSECIGAVSRGGLKHLVLSGFIALTGYLGGFEFSGMDVRLEIPFDPLRPCRAGVWTLLGVDETN